MAIVKVYSKQNDTTYVYDSESYWDSEKGQARSKRKLIGKIDKETGEVIPTGKRGRKSRTPEENPEVEKAPDDSHYAQYYKRLYEASKRDCAKKDEVIAALENQVESLEAERNRCARLLEELAKDCRRPLLSEKPGKKRGRKPRMTVQDLD